MEIILEDKYMEIILEIILDNNMEIILMKYMEIILEIILDNNMEIILEEK